MRLAGLGEIKTATLRFESVHFEVESAPAALPSAGGVFPPIIDSYKEEGEWVSNGDVQPDFPLGSGKPFRVSSGCFLPLKYIFISRYFWGRASCQAINC